MTAAIDGVETALAAVPPDLQPLTSDEERLPAGPLTLMDPGGAARDIDFLALDWSGATVRAPVIRWLAEAGVEIDLEGAEITGALDLSNLTLTSRIRLRRCLFREPVELSGATLTRFDLDGSHVPSLRASRLHCDTLAFGGRGLVGSVDISTARLGHLSFTGLELNAPNGNKTVLDARVLTTSRSADFNGGFEARGRARFIGASIGGQLNFRNAVIHGALSLHEATVARALYLREGLFHGGVNLSEARISGRLDATDATFAPDTASALNLNGTSIDRTAQFNRAVIIGSVIVRNSTIKGSLRLTQAVLRAPTAKAAASKALDSISTAAGKAQSVLAALPAHVQVRSQEIAAEQWEAPDTRRNGLDEQDAGVAMRIDNSSIGSSLVLTAAASEGPIDISATTVTGVVDCRGMSMRSTGPAALRLSESRVGGTLILREVASLSGRLDLSRLAVGRLDDDPGVWKGAESYDIRGLTYDAISSHEGAWTPRRRRGWLRDQTPFSPQPYEQLANLLVRNGRRHEAWRILQLERGDRRSAGALRWWERPGNVLSGLLFGHGYRPEFALVALIVLAALGWVLYESAWNAGAVRPASATETVVGRCTSTGACFEAWRYSLENAFPFLGLKTNAVWRLDDRVGLYSDLAAVQVILGWVLATAGVAGLTRRAVKT